MQQLEQKTSITVERLGGFHHVGVIVIEITVLQILVGTEEAACRGELPRILRERTQHRRQYGHHFGCRGPCTMNCGDDNIARIGIINTTIIHDNRFDLSGALHHSERCGKIHGGRTAVGANARTHSVAVIPKLLHFRIHRRYRQRWWHNIPDTRRRQ